jgi:hypothetical protein
LIESVFLGGRKDIDFVEDRFVEGRGGGYRRQDKIPLTDDDPIYLATALSLFFLLWASSGGLSLH